MSPHLHNFLPSFQTRRDTESMVSCHFQHSWLTSLAEDTTTSASPWLRNATCAVRVPIVLRNNIQYNCCNRALHHYICRCFFMLFLKYWISKGTAIRWISSLFDFKRKKTVTPNWFYTFNLYVMNSKWLFEDLSIMDLWTFLTAHSYQNSQIKNKQCFSWLLNPFLFSLLRY